MPRSRKPPIEQLRQLAMNNSRRAWAKPGYAKKFEDGKRRAGATLLRMEGRLGARIHDPDIRKLYDKIEGLPFAFVNEDCSGHLENAKGEGIDPSKARKGQKLLFRGAYVDIGLSNSPNAKRFIDAVYSTFSRAEFIENVSILPCSMQRGLFGLGIETPSWNLKKTEIPVAMQQNQAFLDALEAIVDRFSEIRKKK